MSLHESHHAELMVSDSKNMDGTQRVSVTVTGRYDSDKIERTMSLK